MNPDETWQGLDVAGGWLDESPTWTSFDSIYSVDPAAPPITHTEHPLYKTAFPAPDLTAKVVPGVSIVTPGAHPLSKEGMSHGEDNEPLAASLIKMAPGLRVYVPYPCGCRNYNGGQSVQTLIIHLNDDHHPKQPAGGDPWSRERIADWLDTLDVNLTLDSTRPLINEGVTYWTVEAGGKTRSAHLTVRSAVNSARMMCASTSVQQLQVFEVAPGMGKVPLLTSLGALAKRKEIARLCDEMNVASEPGVAIKAQPAHKPEAVPTDVEAMAQLQQAMGAISEDLAAAFKNLGAALAPALEQIKTLMDSEVGQALLAENNKKEMT